jgi:hypothetical protein
MCAVLIMLCAVVIATLGVHLQLWAAISSIAHKIATCAKCSSFWLSLATLVYLGCDIIIAVALSIIGSYLSHYVGLILIALNNIYDELWQRINNKQ